MKKETVLPLPLYHNSAIVPHQHSEMDTHTLGMILHTYGDNYWIGLLNKAHNNGNLFIDEEGISRWKE